MVYSRFDALYGLLNGLRALATIWVSVFEVWGVGLRVVYGICLVLKWHTS